MQSVVSFDQGGEWVPLRKPANSKCDATAKDPDKVNREKIESRSVLIETVYFDEISIDKLAFVL